MKEDLENCVDGSQQNTGGLSSTAADIKNLAIRVAKTPAYTAQELGAYRFKSGNGPVILINSKYRFVLVKALEDYSTILELEMAERENA